MEPEPFHSANDLTVQQLRSFCVVYEHQSYSAAARAVGLAAPTLWEQVQAVERCYGAALFRREGRQIRPSPVGTVLYEALIPVMAGLDSTFDVVRDDGELRSATLRVVTGMRMLLEELGEALMAFREQNPSVSLTLLHGDRKTAQQLISAGDADLGLTLDPGPDADGGEFAFEKAYDVEYLAIVPRDHPLASRRALPLHELVKYPLIAGHQDTSVRRVLNEALHRKSLMQRATFAMETDNGAFTAACVRAGLGVGILAGKAGGPLTGDLVGLSLRRQLGDARIVFMWKSGRHLTRAMRSLMALVTKQGGS